MRVNHCGEICAQALYQGQALCPRRDPRGEARTGTGGLGRNRASELDENGASPNSAVARACSIRLWYAGSLAIGTVCREMRRRVEPGLPCRNREVRWKDTLKATRLSLPAQDRKSWEVLEQMKLDEMRHAETATHYGARGLPLPIKAGDGAFVEADDATVLRTPDEVLRQRLTSKLCADLGGIAEHESTPSSTFSADSLTARSTTHPASGLFRVTTKCMLMLVKTLGSVSARVGLKLYFASR
jgi:hypothetical protein